MQPPFYDATWEVRFTDSDEAEELAYIACHKRNWAEYWLMLDSVRWCLRCRSIGQLNFAL